MGGSRHSVPEVERQASILRLDCFHGVYADLVEDVHQLLLLFVDPAVVVVDRRLDLLDLIHELQILVFLLVDLALVVMEVLSVSLAVELVHRVLTISL